jgi:dienelactone hydrolase
MKQIVLMLTLVSITVTGCAPQPASTGTAGPMTGPPTYVPPTPVYSVEVTKDLGYTTPLQQDVPVQKLDVYAPTEPGPWPVAVVLPAYMNTKDTVVYASLAKELAGWGAVVFVANWRSSSPIDGARNDGLLFREAAEELTCAIRFARAKAVEYAGDPGWVTLVGHASGEAAEMTKALVGDDSQSWQSFASSRGGPPQQVECLATAGSAQVDALVEYGGNYTAVEYLKEQDPELWALVSPFALIGKNPGLRVRLVHGKQDQGVSVEKASQFHKALIEAGYDATLTVIEGEHQLPWPSAAHETVVQTIMEAARH